MSAANTFSEDLLFCLQCFSFGRSLRRTCSLTISRRQLLSLTCSCWGSKCLIYNKATRLAVTIWSKEVWTTSIIISSMLSPSFSCRLVAGLRLPLHLSVALYYAWEEVTLTSWRFCMHLPCLQWSNTEAGIIELYSYSFTFLKHFGNVWAYHPLFREYIPD